MPRPETEKQRAAYFAWYEAGRDFAKTAQNLPMNHWTLRGWSDRFSWNERADKLDKKVMARENAKAESDVVARQAKMRARQRQIGEAMVTMGANYLAKNQATAVTDIRDAALVLEKGFALQTKGEGLPDWVAKVLTDDKETLLAEYHRLDSEIEAQGGIEEEA